MTWRTKRKGGKKQENEGELPSATDAASTSSIAAIDTFKAAVVVPSKAADWYSDKMGCCAVEALRSANRCELLEIGDGGSGGGGGAHMSGLS
ncbi:hypothetical protein QJS10_CPA02g00501 [Acorus calamus]|uniref:Uncharacterized protein n=1 Tax=Acorus calamus TaxID=4465 RepID=A0AAV9FDQ5_ACOCL|nr:hypothetical protein QJS10_CPA02g00501 [Acorus calamus]